MAACRCLCHSGAQVHKQYERCVCGELSGQLPNEEWWKMPQEEVEQALTGGPLTPLEEAAVAVREMYLSLRNAGFSAEEATSIVAKSMALVAETPTDG